MTRLFVFALATAVSGAAVGQTSPTASPAPPPPAAQPQVQVKEKPVCRRDIETGSMMPKRVCHSAAEWAAIDQANGANAQQAFDQRRDGGRF